MSDRSLSKPEETPKGEERKYHRRGVRRVPSNSTSAYFKNRGTAKRKRGKSENFKCVKNTESEDEGGVRGPTLLTLTREIAASWDFK